MLKFGQYRSSLVPLLTLLAAAAPAVAQTAVGRGFTYQGKLNLSGQPVDGSADLQFSLFDAASAGNAVAPTQTVLNVNVVEGLFTTQLDFGVDAFAGNSRWIEIAVRSPAGSGGYTKLSPRQRLTAAPVAWYAMRPWIPLNGNFYLPMPVEGNGVGIGLSAPVTRLHVRAPAYFPAETMRIDDFFGRSQLRIATPESAGRIEVL